MNRLALAGAAAAIVAAAGVAYLGRGLSPWPGANLAASAAQAAEAGAPIYFRDPDGKPSYSLTPKKTSDGRDYQPVAAGADLSFDEPETPMAMPAAAKGERKVKYYRNPMGLPDTSPVPKKDSCVARAPRAPTCRSMRPTTSRRMTITSAPRAALTSGDCSSNCRRTCSVRSRP